MHERRLAQQRPAAARGSAPDQGRARRARRASRRSPSSRIESGLECRGGHQAEDHPGAGAHARTDRAKVFGNGKSGGRPYHGEERSSPSAWTSAPSGSSSVQLKDEGRLALHAFGTAPLPPGGDRGRGA
ncbi:MAG: hypothetical protein MZV64_14655 [Ignavibacteriales bacterium]|nr:hypothetical protein [Ignavibacteriales bacterium]